MRDGFFAIFYTGKAGSGTLMVCFKEGKLIGVDGSGGVLRGTYLVRGEEVVLDLEIEFAPGLLVTGQTLTEPLKINPNLTVPVGMFSGDVARVDLGLGPANARAQFISELL